jgi:hypothetical protein
MVTKYLLLGMGISTVLTLILVPALTSQKVVAQQLVVPPAQQPQPGTQPQKSFSNFSNFTASIPLASSLLEVLKSKIKVSLPDAITIATKSIGPNATTLAASVQAESGFLVYRVVALGKDNNIHMLFIDPANGDLLSQAQWPASMSKAFASIPGINPQIDVVPSLRVP